MHDFEYFGIKPPSHVRIFIHRTLFRAEDFPYVVHVKTLEKKPLKSLLQNSSFRLLKRKPCCPCRLSSPLHLRLSLSPSQLQPLLVPFSTIPSVLGRCFKAMSLDGIFPSKFIFNSRGNIYVQNVSFFTILSLL